MASRQHNIGAYLKAVPIIPSTSVCTFSSNGAPNATEVVGRIIDRLAFGRRYLSAKVVIGAQVSCTGGAATGASVTTRILHATSTAAGDFAALGSTGTTTTFGATTTSTSVVAVHEQNIDLRTARRYLQVNVTPTLTASSSGSYTWGGALILGGADELPHSTSDAASFATTS